MGLSVGWFLAAYLAGAVATYGGLLHAARSKIRARAKPPAKLRCGSSYGRLAIWQSASGYHHKIHTMDATIVVQRQSEIRKANAQ